MSMCSEPSPYESFEYNPCIRKGKHKPKYKKQKKYEAKVQKTNLIRPKRGKSLSTNYDSLFNNCDIMIKNMIKILKKRNEAEWDDDYESLYTHIFRFTKDDEIEKLYNAIQHTIYENNFYDSYDDYDYYSSSNYYDDYDDYEYRCQCFKYMFRRYRRRYRH